MSDIYVGEAAIDRPNNMGANTTINKGNPANASGKITSVEIWAEVQLVNCIVATFFVVSGNYLSSRSYHNIGNVSSGSKQIITDLDIAIQIGDYIGITYNTGDIDRTWTGGGGHWYTGGQHIPCTNKLFNFLAGDAISLCGKGETVPEFKNSARTGIYSFKTIN